MPEPLKTTREVLAEFRANRSPEVEIAIQDFLELSPNEQSEFVVCALAALTSSLGRLLTKAQK